MVTGYVILQNQKKQVRREVKKQLIEEVGKEQLVLLVFSEKDQLTQLKWEHSKEFEYKGQMYDVVDKKIKGDTTFYWCWWDHAETHLNKQLKALVVNVWDNHPKNQENKNRLENLFKHLYFPTEREQKIQIAVFENDLFTCYINAYQSLIQSPIPHPPQA